MNLVKTILLCSIFFILLNSCTKNGCEAYTFNEPVTSPYSNPVWHPGGKILGFNHQVVKSVSYDKCDQKSYASFYADSTGFWIINSDGTNMRRVTTFSLLNPAWSPDGKWIAFANGGVIYKMSFDGENFDTTNIIALTDANANYFTPTWSTNDDTIYYETNKDAPEHTNFYSIWKMSSNGSGQTRITDTSLSVSNGDVRTPYYTNDNQILHFRYPKGSEQMQVFIMNTNSNNIQQITNNPINFPYTFYFGYFNHRVFYESFDVWSCNVNGSDTKKIIANSSQGFSISKDGTLAYVNFNNKVVDKTHGTIWLSNINGSTPKPLTYNTY
jgi:Tol biopolymer transport system component